MSRRTSTDDVKDSPIDCSVDGSTVATRRFSNVFDSDEKDSLRTFFDFRSYEQEKSQVDKNA